LIARIVEYIEWLRIGSGRRVRIEKSNRREKFRNENSEVDEKQQEE